MGLEETEVDAIQRSWQIVKETAKLRVHGVNFFELLFEMIPEWKETYFGNLGPKTSAKYRSHATMIMMTLDSWIENLDDLDLVVDAVLRVGQTHADRDILSTEFVEINKVVIAYLEAGLKENFTKEMKDGWIKLLATVVDIIKEGNAGLE